MSKGTPACLSIAGIWLRVSRESTYSRRDGSFGSSTGGPILDPAQGARLGGNKWRAIGVWRSPPTRHHQCAVTGSLARDVELGNEVGFDQAFQVFDDLLKGFDRCIRFLPLFPLRNGIRHAVAVVLFLAADEFDAALDRLCLGEQYRDAGFDVFDLLTTGLVHDSATRWSFEMTPRSSGVLRVARSSAVCGTPPKLKVS